MRSTSARRELGFVFAVALSGVALVLLVVFAPWYSGVSTATGSPAPVVAGPLEGVAPRP
jgi:hypothetical protein